MTMVLYTKGHTMNNIDKEIMISTILLLGRTLSTHYDNNHPDIDWEKIQSVLNELIAVIPPQTDSE
jgi:hypothetical protein